MLMTGRMREDAARRKAGSFARALVNLHLPGRLVLEAAFAPADPLGALSQAVARALRSAAGG